jgi:hypothetical protein
MTEERSLLNLIHQFVTDDSFRSRLMHAPRDTLITELGISRETYDALVTLAPVLVLGGLFLLEGGMSPGGGLAASSQPGTWSGWGRG